MKQALTANAVKPVGHPEFGCIVMGMDYELFKRSGTIVKPPHWPTEGAHLLMSLEGTIRVQCAAKSHPLEACTGIVLHAVERVECEAARGLWCCLTAPSVLPAGAFVLDPLVAHMMLEVFFENRKDEPHRQAALTFILHHLGLKDGLGSAHASDDLSTTDAVMAYMQAHLDEPVTLEDLASAIGCGPQTVIKRFQSVHGQPPMRVLAELRIEKAKSLLAETDASITQIARSVGYSTISGFSHFFKKHTGTSPKQYRQNVQWLI